MRIYEGNYAYEIEQALDPETRVSKGRRVNVYRVRPQDQLLRSGVAATKGAGTTRREAGNTGSHE